MKLTWIALAALLAAAGIFLFHETRSTTLGPDDWNWVLHRRGNSLTTFLRPWNQHLSLIPIAIYRLLFATAGVSDYSPYRALAIVGHLTVVVLVFAYARRRLGEFLALLVAAMVLFLGPGWQEILWPFQIAWLISLAAGVGALLALDRGRRGSDVAACILLAISLASSGIGLPIMLGLIVEFVGGRRRLRDAWIVAAPLAVYALWWVTYQQAHVARGAIFLAPGFAAQEAAGALSGTLGLGGPQLVSNGEGTLLTWGAPLLVVGVGALVWRIAREGRIRPRVLGLLTMALVFWIITAVSRAGGLDESPFDSRYLYVGGLFVVLLAVELARGAAVARWWKVVLALAAVAIVVSNIAVFRDEGADLRIASQITKAELGADDLSRPLIRDDYHPITWAGFADYTAATYFAIEKAIGSPAQTPAQIVGDVEPARVAADTELIRIQGLGLGADVSGLRLGSRPVVDAAQDGQVTTRGACVTFRSSSLSPPNSGYVALTVPPGGLLLAAGEGLVNVGVRRFGDEFQSVGTIAASTRGTLRIHPDYSNAPWHLRLAPQGRVTACGLA